jgi:hypothetical protein
MKALVVALASAALLAAIPTDAVACSCLPWGNAKEELAKAKGAFVGVYLGRRPTTKWPGAALYRFRVERRLKGTLRRTVEVVSANNGAACGLEVARGQRVGLLLRRERGRWHSSLCEQRTARFFRSLPSRRLALCA